MRGFTFVILSALLCAVPGAELALAMEPAVRMEQADDGHLRPKMRTRAEPDYIPPRTRFVNPRRLYVFNDDIGKFAREDATLSRLCRRGAFLQQIDGIYWAETPTRRFGVAFSGGANLVDPQNRRESGHVYFFERQDSLCRVFVAQQAPLMSRFTAPGTGMPVLGPAGIPYPANKGEAQPAAAGGNGGQATGAPSYPASANPASPKPNATGGATYRP